MTRVSFRVWPVGEHETVTDGALQRMAGQGFVFRAEGKAYAARAIAAVVREGWLVITADIDPDEHGFTPLDLGFMDNVYSLPEAPAADRFVPTPAGPDWSSVPQTLAPSRLAQVSKAVGNAQRVYGVVLPDDPDPATPATPRGG